MTSLDSSVERNRLWTRLNDAVAAHEEPLPTPLMVIDLDAFDANADDLVRRAGLEALREDLEASEVTMPHFEDALKATRASVTPEMEREYREIAESLKRESPRGRTIGFQTAIERS